MEWLYKLQRKHGKLAIPNLMLIIVIGQLFIYFANMLFAERGVISWFAFDRAAILSGQVWRLITFIFVPNVSGIIWLLLSLYFYYMIGGALENEWGCFIFNVFYFIGVFCTLIAGFITGVATNQFLNLSLFFAFAILFPDYQIMLFFIIPVKMKYLAIVDTVIYIYYFIVGGWSLRAAIIAALANLAVFFGGTLIKKLKQNAQYRKRRNEFRREMNRWK